jgi:hypothetical protein
LVGLNRRTGTVLALPVLLVLLGGLTFRGCVNHYESDKARIDVVGRANLSAREATRQALADARSECEREPNWISRVLGFSPVTKVVIWASKNPPPYQWATVNCKTNTVALGSVG